MPVIALEASLTSVSPQNAVFLLIGALFGAVFVLDGWRGSVTTKDFKSSPRVKALIWVVGGLLAATITGFSKIGAQLADGEGRWVVIAMYLGGFLITVLFSLTTLTLILLAQLVWCHLRSSRAFSDAAGFPFLPIVEYLHNGYECFVASRAEGLARFEASEAESYRAYLADYADILGRLVVEVNGFREKVGNVDIIEHEILQAVANLTRKLLDDSSVTANYMRAHSANHCPARIKAHLCFAFGNHERYSHYLSLVQSSTNRDRESIALPVEPNESLGNHECILPGAPFAFRRNRPIYIPDTEQIEYPVELPHDIVQALRDYFQRKTFKSFLSLPIVGKEGLPIGILNIDSHRKAAFGKKWEESEFISTTVLPICALLGTIIAIETGNEELGRQEG